MHLKNYLIQCVLAVTGSLIVGQVSAETKLAKEPVSVELKTYLITVGSDGAQTAKLVSNVKPNDVVEYRVTYTNNTSGDIKNLAATLPIPVETQFLAKNKPENATASTDGINFSPMPLKMKEGNQMVNVPLKDYRALRWTVAVLPVGKSITVSAQTRVNSEKTQSK
ncbi:conserved repeat domain-containing protein [Acinetobacter boissieri]|uniref:Conserved repeat domain-containing protein n=1 Tax=Acinetobacter boissieri TaxID=1219383 RepID=A0A1G6GQH7_9GAMM|nr:conserved repeat domain-containing protein [Acinetobacter boissieri]